MKKYIVFITIICAFFIPESQASAASCHQRTASTGTPPQGFGLAHDPFSSTQALLLQASCETSSRQATLTVGTGANTQYIYEKGYVFRNNEWQQINFTGSNTNGAWVLGRATSAIIHTTAELDETLHFVAYVCSWTGSEWKCGCRDSACAQGFWQLQSYEFTPASNSSSGGSSGSTLVPPYNDLIDECGASPEVLHVSKSGSDNNSGTSEGQALQSIGRAMQMIDANGCVQVHSGTYRENNSISPRSGVMVIAADGKQTVTVDASQKSGFGMFDISNNDVTVAGFVVTHPVNSSGDPFFVNGTEGTRILHSKATGGHNILKIRDTSNMFLGGNEIYGQFAHIPVSVTSNTSMSIVGNHFHSFSDPGNGMIQIKGGSRDVVVEGNVFENIDTPAGAIALGDGCGSTCDIDPEHYAGRNISARNNVFVNVGRAADMYGCYGCSFVHNTAINSGKSSPLLKLNNATTGGANRNTVNALIANNIVYNPSGDLSNFVQVNSGNDSGLRIESNLVHGGGSSSQGVTITSDPRFTASKAHPFDYSLAAGSPAIDAGSNQGVARDYEGKSRNGIPDIGAFER